MAAYYLTASIPDWMISPEQYVSGNPPDAPAIDMCPPQPFYHVRSKSRARKLAEMFMVNAPERTLGFQAVHPYCLQRASQRKAISLPTFAVVDGDSLDMRRRREFQDLLKTLEDAAAGATAKLPKPYGPLLKYHLLARQWEAEAAKPRADGLPADIGVLLDRGDFPRLSDEEYAKLGAWLTANAREVYHGLDPANVAKTGRMEEAKKRLRAILEYNTALRQAAAPGAGAVVQAGQQAPAGQEATNAAKTEADWRDVQERLLRLYQAGEPFTSQRDLAGRVGCSVATVNKAIKNSAKLKGWMARHAKPSPNAQSLNDLVTDNVASEREDNPADTVPDQEVDRIMAQLIDQAQPAERAKLNELNDEGRREMAKLYLEQQADKRIDDMAAKGIRTIRRKP